MFSRLLCVFSLATTVACGSAPAPHAVARQVATVTPVANAAVASPSPSTAPPPAPPLPRISLADVVKQVAPGAKIAVVVGANAEAVAADLAPLGLELLVRERAILTNYPRSGEQPHDLVLSDTAGVARFGYLDPIGGKERISIARMRIARTEAARRRRLYVDARCKAEVCDAFEIISSTGKRWFLSGSLPLAPIHENLSWPTSTGERTALGLLVRTADGKLALDLGGTELGGTTRLLLDGAVDPLATALTKRGTRAALDGWVDDQRMGTVPTATNPVLVRVTGDVRLEGTLGMTSERFPPYKRPADAPALFKAIAPFGDVATMKVSRIEGFMDAPTLLAFDARETAALKSAAAKIAAGELAGAADALRDVQHASQAAFGGPAIGRARFLGEFVRVLDAFGAGPTDKAERAFALARTHLAFHEVRPPRFTPPEGAVVEALYRRAATELEPLVEGPDDALARRAVRAANQMYVIPRTHPLEIHGLIYKRFGQTDVASKEPF